MKKSIPDLSALRPVLFMLFLCLPLPAARAMTVAEAVDYAMQHNRDILTMQEQVSERKSLVLQARSEALPQVNFAASSYRMRDPGFLNSTFGQQILRGGTGSESFPIPIEAILPRPQTFYDMNMSFSQPVYTWGKVSNAIQLAHLGISDIGLRLENARQGVAFQVTGSYYNVLLAEETIAMYEKSLEVRRRYLKQTQDFFDVGDATRLDMLRAEAALAASEPGLLEARHSLVQARKRLNFQLGRSLDEELATSALDLDENFKVPALDSVITVAISQRPDLKQLKTQVDMLDKTVNVFKADYRPQVNLTGHFGFSTIDTRDLGDPNYESWRVALEVKVPIFDGFRNRGIVRQYRSQQTQKEIESQTLGEQIRLESLETIDACASALEVYQAQKIALQSAEEEERVTSDNYEQGLVTLYELLDSNRRAVEARKNYISARYNLLQQIAALKRVMGVPVESLFASNE
jgi:outer membrane protein